MPSSLLVITFLFKELIVHINIMHPINPYVPAFLSIDVLTFPFVNQAFIVMQVDVMGSKVIMAFVEVRFERKNR